MTRGELAGNLGHNTCANPISSPLLPLYPGVQELPGPRSEEGMSGFAIMSSDKLDELLDTL